MKQFLLCVSLVSMILVVGCFGGGKSRINPPKLDATAAGKEAIKLYDKNGDGVIKGDELDATPALKYALAWLDKDGDGGISAAEITNRIKEWQDSKTGLTLQSINIHYGGKPVKSGNVILTPEAFLGGTFSPAKGQINDGSVTPSCENNPDGLSGMPLGFYTVTFENLPGGITAPALGIEIFDKNPEFQKSNMYTLELKVK